MDKGVKLRVEEVQEFGARADLFSQKQKGKLKVKILGNYVLFCTSWYQDGRKRTKEHSKTTLKAVFGRIERLYDRNGVMIAQRLNKRSDLLTTGKGECSRLPEPTLQEIYQQIQHQY